MNNRIIQLTGITTTSANENIMTYLKTKTDLNGDTENKSFNLKSIYFQTAGSGKIKINSTTLETDLMVDLVDGLYKFQTFPNEVHITTFIVNTIGTTYDIRFTY